MCQRDLSGRHHTTTTRGATAPLVLQSFLPQSDFFCFLQVSLLDPFWPWPLFSCLDIYWLVPGIREDKGYNEGCSCPKSSNDQEDLFLISSARQGSQLPFRLIWIHCRRLELIWIRGEGPPLLNQIFGIACSHCAVLLCMGKTWQQKSSS